MGNVLYEAIIALGRSIEQIDRDGWMRGSLGGENGHPRCVVGHVSYAMTREIDGGGTFFPYDYITSTDLLLRHVSRKVFPVIGQALIDTLTPEQVERLRFINEYDDTSGGLIGEALGERPDVQALQCAVVVVNDRLLRDEVDGHVIVRRWLSDALDKLAEQLPVPPAAPMTTREIVEAAVEQIDQAGWLVPA